LHILPLCFYVYNREKSCDKRLVLLTVILDKKMPISKIIISVIFVVIVVSLVRSYVNHISTIAPAEPPIVTQPTTPAKPSVVQNTATPLEDTSDMALDTDIADVDALLGKLSNDVSNVDADIKDTPVQQSI